MKFKTRLAIITAIQFTGDNVEEVQAFIGTNGDVRPYNELEMAVLLDNPAGLVVGKPGDYIIRQDEKDVYPCPEHVFINKYQPADEDSESEVLAKSLDEAVKANDEAKAEIAKLTAANKTAGDQIKQLNEQAEALKKQAKVAPAPQA